MRWNRSVRSLTFILLIAALCSVLGVHVSAQDWMSRTGTIGNAVSQPDGSQTYLDAEIVAKIEAHECPAYFVISEAFSYNDRLVVLTTPNTCLRSWETVDVAGTLCTLADGTRAIMDAEVYGYTDSAGTLLWHGPLIKGLLEPEPWDWKVDLTVTGTDTTTSALSEGSSSTGPNTDPAPGPQYYSTVSSIVPDAAQAQDYYGGVPGVQELPAGSLVETRVQADNFGRHGQRWQQLLLFRG